MVALLQFLAGSKGILKRVGILIAICLLAIFVDTFTSFPSLNFEENRYNVLEKMATLNKDSTIPKYVREATQQRMINLSERKSLHEYLNIALWNAKDALLRISKIVPVGNYFLTVLISWIVYVVASSGYFIRMYYKAIRLFGKVDLIDSMKKQILLLGIVMTILTLSIPFLIITLFQISHNLIPTICLCQVGVAIIYFASIFLSAKIEIMTDTQLYSEVEPNEQEIGEQQEGLVK